MTLVTLLLTVAAGPSNDAADLEAAYREARAAAPQTADGQRAVAAVSRQHGMKDRYAAHMLAAAVLEPDTDRAAEIRESLGQRYVAGDWLDAVAARRLAGIERDRSKLKARHGRTLQTARDAAERGDAATAKRLLASVRGGQCGWLIGREFLGAALGAELIAVETLSDRSGFAVDQAIADFAVESDWAPVRRVAIASLADRDRNNFIPVWMSRLLTKIVRRDSEAYGNLAATQESTFEAEGWKQRKRLRSRTTALVDPIAIQLAFSAALIGGRVVYDDGRIPSSADEIRRITLATALVNANVEENLRGRTLNRDAKRRNARVAEAIEKLENVELTTPQEMWDWWTGYQGLSLAQADDEKDLVEISEEETRVVRAPLTVRGGSCFAAGTAVLTPDGPRPIEALMIGDRVVSQDVETGEVRTAVVLQPTSRMADEHFEMHVDGERFLVSGGHPLWEVGHGWRRVRHVEPDRELSTMGGVRPITRLTRLAGGDPRSQEPVYNLIVDGTHTYFVGDSRLLVHDDTIPLPTDCTQPGVAVN